MLDDRQLIKLCQSGRMDAADVLIDRYKDSLYKFCYHLTSNSHDADDLFQETWVKAIKNIHRFDLSKPFGNWLITITLNTYKDSYRKAKRWLTKIKTYFLSEDSREEIDNLASLEFSIDEQLENKDLKSALLKHINSLNDTLRIPLILCYYKEMSYEQISQMLHIPVGTVKSRLNAGRTKLKTLLEADGYG